MTTYAILLVGLALAGDARPPAERKVYAVADLLIPAWSLQVHKVYPVYDLLVLDRRLQAFQELYLHALQSLEKDHVPPPKTDAERYRRYLERLLQGMEKDHVPFPESDLIPLPLWFPNDLVLGYYAPSKCLVEKAPSKRK